MNHSSPDAETAAVTESDAYISCSDGWPINIVACEPVNDLSSCTISEVIVGDSTLQSDHSGENPTVAEDATVIAADDLDSLLAQFEEAERDVSESSRDIADVKHETSEQEEISTVIPSPSFSQRSFSMDSTNTARSASPHTTTPSTSLSDPTTLCSLESATELLRPTDSKLSSSNDDYTNYDIETSLTDDKNKLKSDLIMEALPIEPTRLLTPPVAHHDPTSHRDPTSHHDHTTHHEPNNQSQCDDSSATFADTVLRCNNSSFSCEWDSNSWDVSDMPNYSVSSQMRQNSWKGRSRKRKFENPVTEPPAELLFDKLPNYYTALSIPARAIAGSATRSCSDLISEFARHDRDPSPERCSDPMFNKLPAYHSSFTNSTRYDDHDFSSSSQVTFATDFEPDFADENVDCEYGDDDRFGRSSACEFAMDEGSNPSLKQAGSSDTSSPWSIAINKKEQRSIVYVGRIPRTLTSDKLRQKFVEFGDIKHCSVHYREHGDNYGFVTFADPVGARQAVELGNTIPGFDKFDICFGGRRQFCNADYSDLDGKNVVREELKPFATSVKSDGELDFDRLLKVAKQRLGQNS